MDKISGIIPGSPRVTAVDMKEASPVRPSTPGFGRPEALSSFNKDAALTTAQKAINVQQELVDWRSKDSKHAALVSDLNDKFFVRNQKPSSDSTLSVPQPSVTRNALLATATEVASSPAGFKTDSVGSFRASPSRFAGASAFDDGEDFEDTLAQPEGLYPKGSFIDRTA